MASSKEIKEMKKPPVVSTQEWEAAREKLLVKEKELMHARDAMAAADGGHRLQDGVVARAVAAAVTTMVMGFEG